MRLGQFVRENLEARQLRPVLGRVDCSFRNAPAFLRIELHSAKRVRHDRALDWLRRMTRPPANDVTPQTALGENIPKRFALARSAGVRPRPAVYRVGLDEAMDAVFVGKLSRRDGVPEHWRKNWLERREIAHHAAIDEASRVGIRPSSSSGVMCSQSAASQPIKRTFCLVEAWIIGANKRRASTDSDNDASSQASSNRAVRDRLLRQARSPTAPRASPPREPWSGACSSLDVSSNVCPALNRSPGSAYA